MKILITLCIALILLLGGCQSSIDPYEEGLTPAKLFQKAYEASDNENYSDALLLYKAFKERFPDDVPGNLWAEYEIAFIHYKLGKNKKAITLFNELISKYKDDSAGNYPQAPRILAEKVLADILE